MLDAVECPSPEEMGRLAAGELAPEERSRLLDHALACPRCGEEITLFPAFRDWASESAATLADRSLRPARHPLLDTLLPLATVLFLAVGAALWLRPMAPVDGVYRGADAAAWTLAPPPGASLAEAPRRLELVAEASVGATYEFQVFDEELAVVWRSPPRGEPWVEVPEQVRLRLRGGAFSWRVVVDDGLARRTSPAADFAVAP